MRRDPHSQQHCRHRGVLRWPVRDSSRLGAGRVWLPAVLERVGDTVSIIWRWRLAAARLLLGDGPEGFDYYFRDQVLHTRKQAAPRDSRTLAEIHESLVSLTEDAMRAQERALRRESVEGEWLLDGVPIQT